jgi:hypothetical protein
VKKVKMELITKDELKAKIFTIRGVQVMLDRDLALLYGVQTKALNQAVKRNKERFPESFCFQLNKKLEVTNCDLQFRENGTKTPSVCILRTRGCYAIDRNQK